MELLVSKLDYNGFVFIPNISKLSKSDPAYPYSILMQEPKDDRRKKDVEPEMFREVKVTNIGCAVEHEL